ncbi:putative copper resistance protein D [Nocardioides terrae]|uniref:Putative copper resistance protein D n=1 Tax=Nocardioides terrae TaxID=574651 RepID=A0A1I1JJR9_9ACTN|nr:cytochrome c oxidase assembly protein [Nocardioides terrae]SFC48804.1 putative copper resistance protein D [Nocardioides terrae]
MTIASAMVDGDLMPRLTWSTFLTSWHVSRGWLLGTALIGAAYAALRLSARGRSTVRGWRVAAFLLGCLLLWGSVSSGIGGYAMSLFWMHMVLHLLLIMVVPALLVLGHPITVAVEALHERHQRGARRVLRSGPVGVATHPLTGLLVYTSVIIGTHLTGFMDRMAMHASLMTGEQVLYVAAGFLFLLPLLGEEPLRRNHAYAVRLVVLLVAMVPDTLVGIVLLQTQEDPFPEMMAHHSQWAPPPVSDVNIAGGLMWAGGDGLMMLIAVGLMLSVVTSPRRRELVTGPWLESVRRRVIAADLDDTSAAIDSVTLDPDSDEALVAYNRMLRRLDAAGDEHGRGRPTVGQPASDARDA